MKTRTLGDILEENYPKYKSDWLATGGSEQEYDKSFIEAHEAVMREIFSDPSLYGIRIDNGKPEIYYKFKDN